MVAVEIDKDRHAHPHGDHEAGHRHEHFRPKN